MSVSQPLPSLALWAVFWGVLLLEPSCFSRGLTPLLQLPQRILQALLCSVPSHAISLCIAACLPNNQVFRNLCRIVDQQLDMSPVLDLSVRGYVCQAKARTSSIRRKLPLMFISRGYSPRVAVWYPQSFTSHPSRLVASSWTVSWFLIISSPLSHCHIMIFIVRPAPWHSL